MEAFKQLKRYAVPVLLHSKKASVFDHMAPVVGGALTSDKMGKLIPRAAVVSPDMLTLYGSISYKQMKESKNFSALNRKVKAANKAVESGEKAVAEDVIPCWYAKTGKGSHYPGKFVELKQHKKRGQLLVLDNRGKTLKVPVGRLTALSLAHAKKMQAMVSGESGDGEGHENDKPSTGMETWSSAKGGKTIQAEFVSLAGETITLKKQDGKTVTFKLSLLSPASQKRARELAGE